MENKEEATQEVAQEAQAPETTEEKSEETQEVTEAKAEETPEPSQDIDYYKEQLDKERSRREKADFTIQKLKTEKKEVADEPFEEEKSVSDQVREAIAAEKAEITRQTQSHFAKQLAKQTASNDAEAELIMEHYDHSIVPTGDIETDVRRAKAIANANKVNAQVGELEASLRSQELRSADGGAGGKQTRSSLRPKLSAENEAHITHSGMKWNGEKGRFEGKRFAIRIDGEELIQENL